MSKYLKDFSISSFSDRPLWIDGDADDRHVALLTLIRECRNKNIPVVVVSSKEFGNKVSIEIDSEEIFEVNSSSVENLSIGVLFDPTKVSLFSATENKAEEFIPFVNKLIDLAIQKDKEQQREASLLEKAPKFVRFKIKLIDFLLSKLGFGEKTRPLFIFESYDIYLFSNLARFCEQSRYIADVVFAVSDEHEEKKPIGRFTNSEFIQLDRVIYGNTFTKLTCCSDWAWFHQPKALDFKKF